MKVPRLPVVWAVRFFAVFFLVAGLAVLVVGVHDVVLPGGCLGVLFPAVLLLVAGLVFLGAVWQLIPLGQPRRWPQGTRPPCRQPVPVAFLVSILLGVYIFFGALAGAGTQRTVVLGVSLVFIAVGSLGFVLFWGEIEVGIVRVGAGVALTLAGLLIGGWEFWYQNRYLPTHLDRAVEVQVGLKKLATQGRYDVLSATFGDQDVGGRSITVLGSDYSLTGSHVVSCARAATPAMLSQNFNSQLVDPQRSRFMAPVWEVQPATVLAAGRFVADGKQLGPNVPASRQMIFYVPHNEYQLLRLRAQVFAVSASVPLVNQPPVTRDLGDNDRYDLWKLGGSSWLQDLLSGKRGWIVTRYEIVESPGDTRPSPDLRVTARSPSPTWSGNPPSNAQIKNLFNNQLPLDTTETFADTEMPLAPVTAPTPADNVPKSCLRQHTAATTRALGPTPTPTPPRISRLIKAQFPYEDWVPTVVPRNYRLIYGLQKQSGGYDLSYGKPNWPKRHKYWSYTFSVSHTPCSKIGTPYSIKGRIVRWQISQAEFCLKWYGQNLQILTSVGPGPPHRRRTAVRMTAYAQPIP